MASTIDDLGQFVMYPKAWTVCAAAWHPYC